MKAAGDPKKLKKIKKKRPPENFVNWNEDTFKKLVDSVPEQLTPRMRITHSMVLAEVEQGGNARARVDQLIDDSLQPDEEKVKLHVRAAEVLQTLIDAGVVVHDVDENGQDAYSVTMDLPEDFALDQPLSPFLLAALELLDPESLSTRSTWFPWSRQRWKTRVRCCVRRNARRATRLWRR